MAVVVTVDVDVARLPGMVLEQLHARMAPRLRAMASALLPEVQQYVRQAVEATPEYAQLVAGSLREEFGLPDAPAMVDEVVSAVVRSVSAEVLPPAGEYLGGIFVGAFAADFSDALSASSARYDSVNKDGDVTPVEWLTWLLFAGDAVVIADYGVFRGADPAFSRTGSHIMVKRRQGGSLQPWRVPPAYSGTFSANWLTRAAELAAPRVLGALERHARFLL
jgi:hypothetical protein